jgi:endonuclease/exonuclease/phosphatase (EEP) superfamily protein YafD
MALMLLVGRAAAWLFAVTVLGGLVLRHVAGDRVFIARYVGYVMPWLLVGLLPGALWALLTRQRALLAVLGASAAMIVAVHFPLFSRSRDAVASPSAVKLKVMSYNTFSENGDARRIAAVVLAYEPDVLLLQEIRAEVFERLMESLRELYGGRPVHRAYDPGILQGVVSRHALGSRASMKDKGQAQKVVLRLPDGRPVTVFNVHPLRTRGWSHRYRQISALLEEDVVRERAPVILGGDFNAPDHSQLYGSIAGHLENAHRAAGSGFGFTYPASSAGTWGPLPVPALVRIDHIFFSDHFVALRAGTLEDSGGSDHHPVFAELVLK